MSYREYKCGHKQSVVIINTSLESLSAYTEWQNDNPDELCFNCWIKKRNDLLESKKEDV
jgi:hypothetical protein